MTARAAMAASRASTIWTLTSMATTYSDIGGATTLYGVEVVFRTDGTLDILRDVQGNLNNEVNPYVDPTARTANTWVRASYVSGDTFTAGDTLEVWHPLTGQIAWRMGHNSSGGIDFIEGVFDFELSSDSGGVVIEAQKLSVTIKAGEIF